MVYDPKQGCVRGVDEEPIAPGLMLEGEQQAVATDRRWRVVIWRTDRYVPFNGWDLATVEEVPLTIRECLDLIAAQRGTTSIHQSGFRITPWESTSIHQSGFRITPWESTP